MYEYIYLIIYISINQFSQCEIDSYTKGYVIVILNIYFKSFQKAILIISLHLTL